MLDSAQNETRDFSRIADILSRASSKHSQRIIDQHGERARSQIGAIQTLLTTLRERQASGALAQDFSDYITDSRERMLLTTNALRQRGDIFLEHEAQGCPPVLAYEYEIVMDGADLPYPSNSFLMRIVPPEGLAVKDWQRPYIIIDPRAGHGPRIGGFKSDSQVGVALRDGHPVYFVGFRRMPEPRQYLAYVTRAEAAFVREVMRLHPQSPPQSHLRKARLDGH